MKISQLYFLAYNVNLYQRQVCFVFVVCYVVLQSGRSGSHIKVEMVIVRGIPKLGVWRLVYIFTPINLF